MDLKMHIKSRKMAENEHREAGLGAKQGRAAGAQCPCGCVGAGSGGSKGSRARAVVRLHREKDELIAIPAPWPALPLAQHQPRTGGKEGAGSRRRRKRRRRGCLGTGSLSGENAVIRNQWWARTAALPPCHPPSVPYWALAAESPLTAHQLHPCTLHRGEGLASQQTELLVQPGCFWTMEHRHGVGGAGQPPPRQWRPERGQAVGMHGSHSSSLHGSCWTKWNHFTSAVLSGVISKSGGDGQRGNDVSTCVWMDSRKLLHICKERMQWCHTWNRPAVPLCREQPTCLCHLLKTAQQVPSHGTGLDFRKHVFMLLRFWFASL